MRRAPLVLTFALLAACGKPPVLAGPTALGVCLPTSPTPTPGERGPGCDCSSTIINGKVYDPAGVPAAGAVVRATSLQASEPYQASTTTGDDGSWVINNVPEGARVEFFAGKGDWVTPRHHVVAYTRPGLRNVLDLYAEVTYPAL